MKLLRYVFNDAISIGALTDTGICPAPSKYNHQNMPAFLSAGKTALDDMQRQIEGETTQIALEQVELLAPIAKPEKFFGVSLNYDDHIAETGRDKPEYPTFFNKQNSCVNNPEGAIHLPAISEKLDYEGELAIVIGQRCRHVNYEQAKQVIAGYTIVNDVSVRDWQMRSHTWTLGKSFDTHGPMGPWIVTADELGDPHQLNIKTWINEDKRQDFSTSNMIFDCYYLVEYLSQVMTLEPGDVISTGTGSGVGVKMKPRGYMKVGETVKIEVEGIGTLINHVIDEPEH